MASAQVVETSVTNNSPSQDSNHLDDLFQSRYSMLLLGSNHFLINSIILNYDMAMSVVNIWDIRRSNPSSKPVHPNPNPLHSTTVLIFTERGRPANVDGWPD